MNINEVFENYKLNNINFIKDNINDLFLRRFPINSLKGKIETCDEYCNLLDISDWLLSNGIDVNELDENGNNGLINSILLNNYSYFYLFIKKGININTKSSKGFSPLTIVLNKEYYSEYMAKTLIKLGANLNEKVIYGNQEYSPVEIVALNNNTDILRYLLQHGAKIETQINLFNQFKYSDEITKILDEYTNDLYDLITNWYKNYDPTNTPNLLEFFSKSKNRDLTSLEIEIFGELGKKLKDINYNHEIYKLLYNKELEFFQNYFKDSQNSIEALPLYIMEDEILFFNILNYIVNSNNFYMFNKIRKNKVTFDEKGEIIEYVYDYIDRYNRKIKHTIKREDFCKCKNAVLNFLGRCEVEYNQIGINYTKDELLLNTNEISNNLLYFWDNQFHNDEDILYFLLNERSNYIEYIDEETPLFKKHFYFCLRRNPHFIKKLSLNYRGNMDIFLFIARHCPDSNALNFATEKLKKNEEYQKQLKEIHESFLFFTETREERKKKRIEYEKEKEQRVKEIFERVEQEPSYYKLICDKFYRNRSLALLAIKGDASNILNVSTAFRNNATFIKEARELSPDIDKYFNRVENSELDSDIKNKIIDTIRKYSEKNYLIPIALKNHMSLYLNYPSTILELINAGKEDIVLEKFGDLGRYFVKYYDKFDDDIFFEIYLADISHDSSCRTRIPSEKTHIAVKLLNDKNVIKKLMLINGRELDRYRKEFREDKEIVLAAVSNNWHATKYTSKELQNDKDVILQALQTKHRDSNIYIGKSLKDDKDILLLIDKLNKHEKKTIIWV